MIEVVEFPKIYNLSSQFFREEEAALFLHDFDLGEWIEEEEAWDMDRLAEFSSRVCYTSYGSKQGRTKNSEYLKNIIESGHLSITEHASWTFLITGVSRSLTHELIRHRHLSISELSQRYVDMSTARFVLPPDIPLDSLEYQIWRESCNESLQEYEHLYESILESLKEREYHLTKKEKRNRARQAARSLLPSCTETMIVITGNARTFRHILELRGSVYADLEIRRLAVVILKQLKKWAPNLFYDLEVERHDDGHPKVTKR